MTVAFFSDIGEISKSRLFEYERYLSPERILKSKRYKKEKDYKSCICSGLLLRAILCEYFGFDNISLVFEKTEYGKPFLKGSDIQFSLSHSDNFIACIVSNQFCGIDIEDAERRINTDGILRRFAPDEVSFISRIDDPYERKRMFMRLWTQKEAYLKAKGTGLSGGLDSFTMENINSEHPVVFEDPSLFTFCTEKQGGVISLVCNEECSLEFISADELLLKAAENL